MSRTVAGRLLLLVAVCIAFVRDDGSGRSLLAAEVTDLTTWTVVEDPPDPAFSADVGVTTARLLAGDASIDRGTDIGLQSIDGLTVGDSTAGFFFDHREDFALAIDYRWSFDSADGFLGLGFGIGEDSDGQNSAGVAMLTRDGGAFGPFAATGRTNDVDLTPQTLSSETASLEGSLFVSYDAASGDITLGANDVIGAAAPDRTATFAGLQNDWNDQGLLASFFIRSDGPLPPNRWNGGNGEATFENFRVLSGSATAVPEPSLAWLAVSGLAWYGRRRLRHRSKPA